jgi:hypothetical protein
VKGGAGLIDKFLQVLGGQPGLQHLDGSEGIFVDMLAQVDFTEAATPQETGQAILTKLLPHTISHLHASLIYYSSMRVLLVNRELSMIDVFIVE